MRNCKFVTYLRVSTARQGESGLGLEAQRDAVTRYLNGGTVLREFVEVESGKRNDRPALADALRLCKRHKATLIIAKLDRLARNVAFIANLMESGVEFIAADMPQANKLTIHVMAAMAEYEADAISQRTKDALRAAKARGIILGGRRVPIERFAEIAVAGRVASARVRASNAALFRSEIMPVVNEIRATGCETLLGIATALNERGEHTRRGSRWTPVQVSRLLSA